LLIIFFLIKKITFTLWDFIIDWNLLHFNSKNFLLRDKLLFPIYCYYVAIIIEILFRGSWLLLSNYHDNELINLWMSVMDISRRVMWVILRFESEFTNNIEGYRKVKYVPALPMIK